MVIRDSSVSTATDKVTKRMPPPVAASCFSPHRFSAPFRQRIIHMDVVYTDIAGANICPAPAGIAMNGNASRRHGEKQEATTEGRHSRASGNLPMLPPYFSNGYSPPFIRHVATSFSRGNGKRRMKGVSFLLIPFLWTSKDKFFWKEVGQPLLACTKRTRASAPEAEKEP